MDHVFGFNTSTVVVAGAAVLASTFFRRLLPKNKKNNPRKEFLFDEAWNVMRAFFEKSSLHTVEELQRFGNNWVPAPFWVRVIRLVVPLSTRLEAGRILIDTLGEDEIQSVIGGREWWQRSAQKEGGITGEWISLKKDWEGLPDDDEEDEQVTRERAEAIRRMKEAARKRDKSARDMGRRDGPDPPDARRQPSAATVFPDTGSEAEDSDNEEVGTTDEATATPVSGADGDADDYSPEMDEMRCLYYVHGGGYFFGSINTHRYSIWRYARKIGGRAFSVNYRLAPQYPFPCALSDALAGYLFLIRPPPGSKHKPVDPAKITIAGDSAGGGLALALLCILRDAGLPMPAGAVLISPWCDLTHSFPSILENTATDIVPVYGWLFKPSTLWPPPPPEFQERAAKSTSLTELQRLDLSRQREKESPRRLFSRHNAEQKGSELAAKTDASTSDPHSGDPQKAENKKTRGGEATAEVGKILRVKVDGEEVELAEQIQLYATNDQLVYPFVSPIWQPSLGGLPPLFVMAGDKEVLRDEIVYMAHRAANPNAYPVRKALQEANPERTRRGREYPPTKVHLQVYDGVCHDLPLLSFVTPAKYCYRAISSFIKFVTADDEEVPTELSAVSSNSSPEAHKSHTKLATPHSGSTGRRPSRRPSFLPDPKPRVIAHLDQTIYSSAQPFHRPPFVDNMVRERVSLNGVVRPMEPIAEVAILQMDPEELGLIKEGPVKRYLAGKALWDKRFKRTYEHVQKRREHHLKKSIHEEYHRLKKRVKEMKAASKGRASAVSIASNSRRDPDVLGDLNRSDSPEPFESLQGIWELHGERPPPSSIAARKDTMEARKLANFLDTHYTKLHALHLWSDAQEMQPMAKLVPPVREASEELEQ